MHSDSEKEKMKEIAVEYFQSGMERFLTGFHQQAKLDFLTALEFDEKLVPAYCYLSAIYCESENDPETAIKLCQKALEIDDKNSFLHFCMGSALEAKGLTREALYEFEKYYQDHPDDSECAFTIACAYDRLKDYKLATKFYLQSISLDSSHFKARFNLSLLYAQEGKKKKAIEELEKVSQISPAYWKAWAKLGVYHNQEGNIEKAIQAYQQAVSICPDLIDVHYNLGVSYRCINDPLSSISSFKKVIEANSSDVDAFVNLATSYIDLEEYISAEQALSQAILINLEHEKAHLQLGRLYANTGEKLKAHKELDFLKSIKSSLSRELEDLIKAEKKTA